MQNECSVEGCSCPAKAKGMCLRHYKRGWARGARGSKITRLSSNDRERLGIGGLEYAEFKKARSNAHSRAAYHKHRSKRLDERHGSSTGWRKEAVLAAYNVQEGRCAICPRELGEGRATQRDHYELKDGVRVRNRTLGSTRHPRALLCVACNSGLGHYESANGQRAAGLRIEQYEAYIKKYGG